MHIRFGLMVSAALVAGPAFAQFNVQWVQFQNETATSPFGYNHSDGLEVHFCE